MRLFPPVLCAVVVLLPGLALAQDDATASPPSLIDELAGEFAAFVGIVVAGALSAGAAWLVKLARDRLGDAAADRLKAALDRAVALGEASAQSTVRIATEYLKQQLPGSIRRLKLTDRQLADLVAAELARQSAAKRAAPPSTTDGVTP
jgi:hypothetical protein